MYLGRIVESGPNAVVWRTPHHPYTRLLAASVPTGTVRWRGADRRPPLEGEPPSPVAMPSGCRFHPRCPLRESLGNPPICSSVDPAVAVPEGSHRVACHFRAVDGATPMPSDVASSATSA
jgi:oligopeptide/dipeptide ABC transporter ATP-binding protein